MGVREELERMDRFQTEIEKVGRMMPKTELPSGLGDLLADIDRYHRMPELTPTMLPIQGPQERAAESFMEGLREHADKLEAGLREDQELHMICYHGPERLRVLEISMPSENVVSLRCLNADGDEAHVTGHMYAVTFSYVIHTVVPPEVKRPIGFRMPSEQD